MELNFYSYRTADVGPDPGGLLPEPAGFEKAAAEIDCAAMDLGACFCNYLCGGNQLLNWKAGN